MSVTVCLCFLVVCYLNNVTNLHQLNSHSTTSCPTTWRSYCDHRLLWRHFTLFIRSTTKESARVRNGSERNSVFRQRPNVCCALPSSAADWCRASINNYVGVHLASEVWRQQHKVGRHRRTDVIRWLQRLARWRLLIIAVMQISPPASAAAAVFINTDYS